MSNATFSDDTQDFVARLDQAAQAHMAWTRRVLRCAVLRTSPGADVLALDAHCRCAFGKWFTQNRVYFDDLDAVAAERLHEEHREMHDAVRQICAGILESKPGDGATLDVFERTQTHLIADLAYLKTQCLARSARLDALTGLPLRYGMEEEFSRYRALALRRNEILTLVMLDVDHFKRVNDVHGHAVGDLALQHVATLLRSHFRAGEPLFRFGGEEFLALLQTSDRDAAEQTVQRMQQGLRDNPLHQPEGQMLSLRVSAGLAEVGLEEPMAAAVARADRALYAAKAAGRDAWRWGDTADA